MGAALYAMTPAPGHALRMAVLAVVLAGLILPMLAGSWLTLRAAFGVFPALGADRFSLQPFRDLAASPGFGTSLRLTLTTGIGSTLIALALALGLAAALHQRLDRSRAEHLLTPVLAVPHAALAIGLAFLIAPSGWLVRLISPWATGWTVPPDLALVGDGWGMALMLGLVIKELPFLTLVCLAGLAQLPLRQQVAAAASMGYRGGMIWPKLVLPQLWPLIRLPVLVVQAFALSVVDMALVLGPSHPPTLAVSVMRGFADPDSRSLLPASAGAITIAAGTALVMAGWLLAEIALRHLGRHWLRRGARHLPAAVALHRLLVALALVALALGFLALLLLVLWSLAWRWSFPLALPESWSLQGWLGPTQGWGRAFAASLGLGMASTALSLALAVAWLEGEDQGQFSRARWAEVLIYLPLILPQIGFLYGVNTLILRLGLPAGAAAVIWGHGLLVFPYVMITLSEPWRALDPRFSQTAAALGAGPLRCLLRVKLPLLLAPVLIAAAIGFAVSVALYLPTLILGAGRIATLTTEAVTQSSGADRRITGVYAALQAALPLCAYALALALPRLWHRRRLAQATGAA